MPANADPGLPRIGTYAVPRVGELPPRRVTWTLDPARAALLVHDLQRYFAEAFPAELPPLSQVLPNVRSLVDRCDAAGIPVFYTAQPGRPDPLDRGLQSDFWGPGMNQMEESAAKLVDAVAPRSHHIVLTKWRYSAFQRSPLESMLMARGRDQLLVTGVFAHIGCLLTAAEAFMKDVQPFLVADAVADFSRELHDAAVAYVAGCCGSTLLTSDALEAL